MRSRQVVETPALILHRVPYSESDWVLTLFTKQLGKITAVTPGARKSKRRYAGGLEPFHTLTVRLQGSTHGEMLHLLGSDITEPRHNLVTGLGAMNAAALALRWLRRALPPMLSDERIWVLTQTWLDLLDARPPANARAADARAAEFGLRLLGFLGWALQLERCVRCGTVCPPGRSSYLVLSAGGIVCRACGGAGLILEPTLRAQLVALEGELFLDEDLGAKALKLLEGAFSLHLGIES